MVPVIDRRRNRIARRAGLFRNHAIRICSNRNNGCRFAENLSLRANFQNGPAPATGAMSSTAPRHRRAELVRAVPSRCEPARDVPHGTANTVPRCHCPFVSWIVENQRIRRDSNQTEYENEDPNPQVVMHDVRCARGHRRLPWELDARQRPDRLLRLDPPRWNALRLRRRPIIPRKMTYPTISDCVSDVLCRRYDPVHRQGSRMQSSQCRASKNRDTGDTRNERASFGEGNHIAG